MGKFIKSSSILSSWGDKGTSTRNIKPLSTFNLGFLMGTLPFTKQKPDSLA